MCIWKSCPDLSTKRHGKQCRQYNHTIRTLNSPKDKKLGRMDTLQYLHKERLHIFSNESINVTNPELAPTCNIYIRLAKYKGTREKVRVLKLVRQQEETIGKEVADLQQIS